MEFISISIALLSVIVALYSAKNSAGKNVVDGLSALVASLEKRLNTEIVEREKLERKLNRYERYINLLVAQLRANDITPTEMPEE